MAIIRGVDIADTDAYWLVDELLASGATASAAALEAAVAIETAVATREPIESLTPAQTDAVMDALAYARTSLEPLRAVLMNQPWPIREGVS